MLKIFLYIILGYIILAGSAHLFVNTMIFPIPLSSYRDNGSVIKLKTKDGKLISAVFLPNLQARYTLLVSHGNAEDIGYMFPFLQALQKAGFAVFAYDYHGYGTSEGYPNERNVYYDAQAAYDYLTMQLHIKPKNIISFGRSVGAAAAIEIAKKKPVAALIVQSPFMSAFRVVTFIPIFPFDPFNNLAKIKQIHCPVLVIHGTRDFIIPFWHGKAVYENANPPKEFFRVKGAGHNNLIQRAGQLYFDTIKKFTDNVDRN